MVRKSGQDYKIDTEGTCLSRSRISTVLNVLGSVGYYEDGPRRGVEACIKGFDHKVLKLADELEGRRKIANRKMLSELREGGLSQGKSIQWFHDAHNYSGMSGKVIGSFCSHLRYQRGVNPVRYLIGMMNVPAEVPGWGSLPAPLVKVSGRAPQILSKLIERGQRPALSKILARACSAVGGFGDGHRLAASGVIGEGTEREFLDEMERLAGY